MKRNIISKFYLDTFRKLQEFLEERTEERLNKDNSDSREIENLITLQDYLAKFSIVNLKDESVEIELSQDDYEILFGQLLIPAIVYYDRKRLYNELYEIVDEYKELTDDVIAQNDYLEKYSDYQEIIIENQKQLIDKLTDKLLEETTD